LLSCPWRKVMSDARAARGRLVLMGLALAVSGAALTTMLSTYAVLGQQLARNYLSTNPASAQLVLDRSDEELARAVARFPGVADAETASAVWGRVALPAGGTRPALLFVVPHLGRSRINTVRLQSGEWPAADDQLVLERSALQVAQASIGDSLTLQFPNQRGARLEIVGTVHDPALAPAWQEQVVYGYVTPAALARIDPDLHILKVVVAPGIRDAQAVAVVARDVARRLAERGRAVREIRIPPPRMHPHQSQVMTLLAMLLGFSACGLLLGSVLGAAIVAGFIAQHVQDIAVMKAIGARSVQIAALYLVLVGGIALVAAVAAIPLGLLAAADWVSAIAKLLNLDIASVHIPWLVATAGAAVAVWAPITAAGLPVWMASRRTVRQAMSEWGLARESSAPGLSARALLRVRGLSTAVALGLRNAFRRRARLLLSVAVFASAGAMFIASAELRGAWSDNIAASAATRRYDLEIRLQNAESAATVRRIVEILPGVREVESWPVADVAVDDGDHIAVSHSYPDEGHGRITIRAAPPETHLFSAQLVAGRWLRQNDDGAVVLNSAAQVALDGAQVGDRLDLLIRHEPRHVHVVGIAREIMTPATLYTTADGLAGRNFPADSTNAIRMALLPGTAADTAANTATASLESAGIAVRGISSEKLIQASQNAHIRILISALGFVAAIMTLVGVLGHASMLGTGVAERIREFGILRIVGAGSGDIRRVVLSEAMIGGLLGAAAAIPLSVPISQIIGRIVGRVSGQPLVLELAAAPVGTWLAICVAAAALGGLYPSMRAARWSVRETLAGPSNAVPRRAPAASTMQLNPIRAKE
jgi:putative ABC transport system permease protein